MNNNSQVKKVPPRIYGEEIVGDEKYKGEYIATSVDIYRQKCSLEWVSLIEHEAALTILKDELTNLRNEQSEYSKSQSEKLFKQADLIVELIDVLEELTDLMDEVRNGEYKPDLFTTQPARTLLTEYKERIND